MQLTDGRRMSAYNMGIAARVAGPCNLRLQFAISSGFGGRNSVELLVVIMYFKIFIGQQFRAGQAINSTPAAIPVRCLQAYCDIHTFITKTNDFNEKLQLIARQKIIGNYLQSHFSFGRNNFSRMAVSLLFFQFKVGHKRTMSTNAKWFG